MDTYGKRLQAAMDSAQRTRKMLAAHLGSSVQAVGMVITGKMARLDTLNHSKAAQYLGVDPHWLATGDGDMQVSAGSTQPGELSQQARILGEWLDKITEERSRFRAYVAAMQAIVDHLPGSETPPTDAQSAVESARTPPARPQDRTVRR